MAGGMAVLGGVVAGPALAILGFAMDSKASSNLDKAYERLDEAKVLREELRNTEIECKAIAERSEMFIVLYSKLYKLFMPLIQKMEISVTTYGVDFQKYPKRNQEEIVMAATLAKTVKAVADTLLLTNDGQLTSESKTVYTDTSNKIDDVAVHNMLDQSATELLLSHNTLPIKYMKDFETSTDYISYLRIYNLLKGDLSNAVKPVNSLAEE
jgi:hypothetical protein